MEPVLFGVIGGSGVYKMDCLTDVTTHDIDTPFGKPSDAVTVATLSGMRCAFIPRHGRTHSVTPTEVNYRANIFALKSLGVKYLLSVTAVGSLHEGMQPGDLVLVDQLIDRTNHRQATFFGNGLVGHVQFGHPTCDEFRARAADAIKAALPAVRVHCSGCLVTMEGPAFSTKAESLMNRKMGGDLIGMTTSTEAKLAREAEMALCVVAMVTDLDAWTDNHVSVEAVVAVLKQNAANAQKFIGAVADVVAKDQFNSPSHDACAGCIMTTPENVPSELRKNLAPLFGRYIKPE